MRLRRTGSLKAISWSILVRGDGAVSSPEQVQCQRDNREEDDPDNQRLEQAGGVARCWRRVVGADERGKVLAAEHRVQLAKLLRRQGALLTRSRYRWGDRMRWRPARVGNRFVVGRHGDSRRSASGGFVSSTITSSMIVRRSFTPGCD